MSVLLQEQQAAGGLAGCCGFCGPRERYFDALSLVELQETFLATPRPATLARWRTEAPADVVFTMRAAQRVTHESPSPARGAQNALGPHGLLRSTSAVREAYESTLAAARAVDALAIIFETPMEFTPTAANRKQLTEFFSRAERDGRWLVWQPQGVWSDDEVQRICADLDLVPAQTHISLEGGPGPGARAYFRLNAPRISEDHLLLLADQMSECEVALCLFNGPSMFRDAQRLQALLCP
jgi:uncharacterized protein YecE (DUF72 family)